MADNKEFGQGGRQDQGSQKGGSQEGQRGSGTGREQDERNVPEQDRGTERDWSKGDSGQTGDRGKRANDADIAEEG